MNNAYHRRFNLDYNPFVKTGKETLIETSHYKEALFRLNYLLSTKGFGVITGEPGLGKTTCVRTWAKSLNEAAYKIIYIPIGNMSVSDFYRYLAEELGNIGNFTKLKNFQNIQKSIERYEREKHIIPIIIIDEADQLTNQTLMDLKVLFNFDMDNKNRSVTVLVGQKEILVRLRQQVHEPLRQRISVSYEFGTMSFEDGQKYIKEKLNKAGCKYDIFEESAMRSLLEAANFVPRIIDSYVDKAMIIADLKNKTMIDNETVQNAISFNASING